MKTDIILAGVGGQGTLSIAAAIGFAALEQNLYMKQSEVHGMSQRGGAVQSHMRISDKPIASDLISLGKADLIISVEPMEALRYLPFLSHDGWLVTNTNPYINIPDYPAIQSIIDEIEKIENHVAFDADELAKQMRAARASNIMMLGAASHFMSLTMASIEFAIRKLFQHKGNEIVEMNLKALRKGREMAFEKV